MTSFTPFGGAYRLVPLPLGLVIFLLQVAVGIVLFAIFQQYVPRELGAGDAWGGYLLSAYGGSRFLSEGPTGAINDRIERKLALVAGAVVLVPAIGVMALVENYWLFLPCAAVLGVGSAFLWPAAYAICADLYPPGRRGKVIGFLNVCQLLGFGAGALIGAFLVGPAPKVLLVVAIACVGAAGFPAVFGIPSYRTGRLYGRIGHDERRPTLRAVWSGQLAGLVAIVLVATAGVAMVVPAIRPYGTAQLGVEFSTLTVALIPAVVLGGLMYVPAGHAADRFGRLRPFLFGQICLIAGALAVAQTTSLPIAATAAAFIFMGNVFSVPAFNAAVLDLAPESHRGTLIGLTVAVSGLGLALGPGVGGYLSGEWGPPAVFRVSALVAAIAGVAIVIYGRRVGAVRHAGG